MVSYAEPYSPARARVSVRVLGPNGYLAGIIQSTSLYFDSHHYALDWTEINEVLPDLRAGIKR